MAFSRTFSRLDLNLLITALLLAGIGCLLVYSATYFGPDAPTFRKQLVWTAIGIVLMPPGIVIDYHLLLEASPLLYGIGLVLLGDALAYAHLTRRLRAWLHT